jgi:hypothetical protein
MSGLISAFLRNYGSDGAFETAAAEMPRSVQQARSINRDQYTRRAAIAGGLAIAATVLARSPACAEVPDINKAYASFNKRRMSGPGLQSANDAIAIANSVLATQPSGAVLLYTLILLASAEAFIGLVSNNSDVKEQSFRSGARHADKIVKDIFGISLTADTMQTANAVSANHTADELDLVALSLLLSSVNYAGLGTISVVQGLGGVLDIRRRLAISTALKRNTAFYYAHETIDAILYYKIPGLLGGDLNKSLQKFKTILAGTRAQAHDCSVVGLVNCYYCQALGDNGDTDAAKSLGNTFVNAPAIDFPHELRPENEYYRLQTIEALGLL